MLSSLVLFVLCIEFLFADSVKQCMSTPDLPKSNLSTSLPQLSGYIGKALFFVTRAGLKVRKGGIDFRNLKRSYFSSITLSKLEKAGIILPDDIHYEASEDKLIRKASRDAEDTLASTGERCEREIGDFYKSAFGQFDTFDAYVYADDHRRDYETAEAFMMSIGYDNDLATLDERIDQSSTRMLFDPGDNKTFEGCLMATPNELMRYEEPLDGLDDSSHREALTQDVSTYGKDTYAFELKYVSQKTGTPEPFENRTQHWEANLDEPATGWEPIAGGLRDACQIIKIWELEIASNDDVNRSMYHALGVDPDVVPRLMRICASLWDIATHPLNMGRNIEFAIHLLSSLDQAVSGESSKLASVHHVPSSNLIVYYGHNNQVELLRQILGVTWSLAGNPENTIFFHTRLNVEVLKQTNGDAHFVRVSAFSLNQFYDKAGCAGRYRPTVGNNLQVLDLPRSSCPSFDDETKLCPWNEFKEVLSSFIWTHQRADGSFCAEPASVDWFFNKFAQNSASNAESLGSMNLDNIIESIANNRRTQKSSASSKASSRTERQSSHTVKLVPKGEILLCVVIGMMLQVLRSRP